MNKSKINYDSASGRKRLLNKNTAPYIFLIPAVLLFAVFTIYPFVKTFILSFQTREAGHYVFSGLANYKRLLGDRIFLTALYNTFIYLIIQVPVMTVLSLLMAVGLNSRLLAWKSQFRLGFFLPAVTEMVAYSMVFFIILSDNGLLNYVLYLLHLDKISWLTSPFWAKMSIIMALTWRWTGYNAVIMLAGLQNIPDSLYEAATIDGANQVQKFFHITVPQMRPIILFSVILSTIGTLNLFSEPYILTNGGPADATITMGLYLYKQGFQSFNFCYASAISVVILIITVLFSIIQLKIGGKENA
ncbi:MAG: sugar ABC transporter permease [Lentisphaerota bacterium]